MNKVIQKSFLIFGLIMGHNLNKGNEFFKQLTEKYEPEELFKIILNAKLN